VSTKQDVIPGKSKRTSSIKYTKKTMARISIDIIGPLLQSHGQDAIIVIVDQFTKII